MGTAGAGVPTEDFVSGSPGGTNMLFGLVESQNLSESLSTHHLNGRSWAR